MHKLRVFLSSPGDVAAERDMVRRVVARFGKDRLWGRLAALEIVAWDDPDAPALMPATLSPQEAINHGYAKPSECDIAVFILWSRMGTPLDPERHGRKPDGGVYLSGTEWEFLDAVGAAERTGRPLPLLYRRTDDADAAGVEAEQARRVAEFFASFTSAEGYLRHGFHSYEKPLDFWSLFDSHLRSAVERLVPLDGTEGGGHPSWRGSPYPGLRSFDADEGDVFFGRVEETNSVLEGLRRGRFVAVMGSSGSGKSSLVKAGVIAHLRQGALSGPGLGSQLWNYVICTPGGAGSGNPFEALFEGIVDGVPALRPPALSAPRVRREFVEEIMSQPTGLIDMIAAAWRDSPSGGHVVFVIDQFEEIYTTVPGQFREPFFKMLAAVAVSPLAHVLVTLRSDFYDQLAQCPPMVELVNQGQYLLSAPGAVALTQMITLPAERAHLRFEEGLPDRILDDTGRQPGGLPLMASVLRELYGHRTREGVLTHASYDDLGGVEGTIERQGREAQSQLETAQQELLPELFDSLVTLDDKGISTRRTVFASGLLEGRDDLREIVDILTDRRLLVKNAVGGKVTIEIAHEALLRHWSALAAWIRRVSRSRKLHWDFPRSSGVLMPIPSLSGPHGIGGLGREACAFVDWLHDAAQTWWQIAPVGPSAPALAPYSTLSSFAGNPPIVSLNDLARRGWLTQEDLASCPSLPDEHIDYPSVCGFHERMLELAFDRFSDAARDSDLAEFRAFCHDARSWLEPYAAFAAVRERFGGRWQEWPASLARYDPRAVDDVVREMGHEVERQKFVQWAFDSQWMRLKRYANERGVRVLCDLPVFVPPESADVWSHQDLFMVDHSGWPTVMAGMPPDAFSESGSNWGLPQYRWEAMRADGWAWWKERFRVAFRRYDSVRIVGVSGLFRHWELPTDGGQGRYADGPGRQFFAAMSAEFGRLPLVFEDLDAQGNLSPERVDVVEVRDKYRIPGVKILQFAFDEFGQEYNPFKPHWFGNSIVYTSTPDLSTTRGWWGAIEDRVKANVAAYMGPVGDPPRDLMRLAMMSAAHTVITPLADVLGYGDEARLNSPGYPDGWTWRVPPEALKGEATAVLRHMTELFDRVISPVTNW